MDLQKPTQADLERCHHVFLTSDAPWDPTVLDNEYDEQFYDAIMDDPEVVRRREERDPRVDDFGYLRARESYTAAFNQDEFIQAFQPTLAEEVYCDAYSSFIDYIEPQLEPEPPSNLERSINCLLSIFPNQVRKRFPDLEKMKPYFGWASTEKIKQMLDKTTQHYRGVIHYPFRKHFKSRFPGANVHRLHEWMAMDTFFSNVPAKDDGIPGHAGCTMLQVFLGLQSGYTQGIPMKSETQVPEAIEEVIRKTGAPIGLRSDQAKAELHGRSKELLKMHHIDGQSEAQCQHQNPAERMIQDIERNMNNIMDRTNCPEHWWLLQPSSPLL